MLTLESTNVLVVDDEPDLCEMLRFEFAMNGCRVFQASGGDSAFDLLLSHPIDVVVSDIRMSGGNGIELLEKIRNREGGRQPFVIFITAYDTALLAREAYDRGVEGFFAKPFRLRDLVKRVESLLVPPELRWATPPPDKPPTVIERHFDDLETARANKWCDLGRGGIALITKTPASPRNRTVGYEVTFRSGPVQAVRGMGQIAWVDTRPGAFRAGIEFQYLEDESRGEVLEWLRADPCRAFIPKL